MNAQIDRRAFLLAAGGLLLPAATPAASELHGAEDIDRYLGEEFWRRFQRGVPQLNGEIYTPFDDAAFNRAMTEIAKPIMRQCKRTSLQWRIGTADDSTVNAYAPGGGVICMLRGLVRTCENETELAVVIAHEVGHIQNRHVMQRILAHQLFVTIGQQMQGKREVSQALVDKRYAEAAPEVMYAAYGRQAEFEADAFAMHALASTNYDLRGAHTIFEKLAAMGPGEVPLESCLISTHPQIRDRIARIKLIARRAGKQRARPDSAAFRYLKSVA